MASTRSLESRFSPLLTPIYRAASRLFTLILCIVSSVAFVQIPPPPPPSQPSFPPLAIKGTEYMIDVGGLPPVFSPEGQRKLESVAMALQKRLVALVPGAEHIIVEGVGHNIHLDKPEAVLTPILTLVARLRDQARR